MRDLDVLPAQHKQAGTKNINLSGLEEKIRAAHAGVALAFAAAIDRALEAGRALNTARDKVEDGKWGAFLRRCDVNERTAQRYMQLARLVDPSLTTAPADLKSLSIEQAIRRLSPPPASKDDPAPKKSESVTTPVVVHPPIRTTHVDILDAWMHAPSDERQQAIDGIGLDALLAVMPKTWLPLTAERLTESAVPAQPLTTHVFDDELRIPNFLQRSPVDGSAQ